MKRLDYRSALKYLCVFVCFFACFNAIYKVPLSISALPAFLCEGFSFFAVFVVFSISAFIGFGFYGGAALCFSAAVLCVVYYVLKKRRVRAGIFGYFFVGLALLPYVFLPVFSGELTQKIIYSAVAVALSVVFSVFVRAVLFKGLRRKFDEGELAACAVCLCALALGFINVFSAKTWQIASVTAVIFACYLYKSPRAYYFAFVLPLASCVFSFSILPLAESFIYCTAALVFVKKSKLLTSLFCAAVCAVLGAFNDSFSSDFAKYIIAFLPCVIFLFFPEKIFSRMRAALCAFDETAAVRGLINDERRGLSAKLYSIGAAFERLNGAALKLENYSSSEQLEMKKLAENVTSAACENCPKRADCLRKNRSVEKDVLKILSVGASKGRVRLIDVPKNFSEYCCSLNTVIYEANKSLSEYSELKTQFENAKNSCAMLGAQAGGAGCVLKNLSYELSACVRVKSKTESRIFEALCLEGIIPSAVLGAGEEEFHLIFVDGRADLKKAAAIISREAGVNVGLSSKTDLGSSILCAFKKRPAFDASFGVARRKKDGSPESGDSHSLTKINEGRFLVALCDGMGSGESARDSSNVALELVEALAGAGLNSEGVAAHSNALLSLCFSDSFCTLDMAIIDLYAGICTLVKAGATFGLISSKEGVKVIENSALPLGVLNEIQPAAKVIDLRGGEIIVLASDGVTDAFFSSTEAAEFVQSENCANPQSLAEKILMRAIENTGGIAEDDMTVIAVKIYKNDCA